MARPPARTGISPESERELARLIVSGVPLVRAARQAGFPNTARPERAMETASFRYELQLATKRRFEEHASEALIVMVGLMRDKATPARVRLDAAKAIADRGGFPAAPGGRDDQAGVPTPQDMSQDQLLALIERLERERSERAVLVGSNASDGPAPNSFLD